MMKPDFSQMTRQELRAYILAHREDDAIEALIKRGNANSPNYKFPQTDEDLIEMEQILKKKLIDMTETSKYDLRGANIGNFADTIQSGGRQEATQYIYAPEQDFNKLLADYQQFFDNLQQKYPTQIPEVALLPILDAEFQEIQKTQPQRWQNFLNLKRLWNGGKKATFKLGEHFTEENLWGKMAIAFLEGILETPEN